MDSDTAFFRIQTALEEFNADVGKATAQQEATKDTIASIEYELELLKQLISDNRLSAPRGQATLSLVARTEPVSPDNGTTTSPPPSAARSELRRAS